MLIASSFLLCSCPAYEDGHDHITIKNNSTRRIAYQARNFNIGEIDNVFNCKYVMS